MDHLRAERAMAIGEPEISAGPWTRVADISPGNIAIWRGLRASGWPSEVRIDRRD